MNWVVRRRNCAIIENIGAPPIGRLTAKDVVLFYKEGLQSRSLSGRQIGRGGIFDIGAARVEGVDLFRRYESPASLYSFCCPPTLKI